MKNRKKIMFLSHRDATDKRVWSGTFYSMAKALEKHSGDIVYAGPYFPELQHFLLKAFNRISLSIFRKRYRITYSYILARAYKKFFEKRIQKENPDIVFAPSSSAEISLLDIKQPIVYLGDATLNLLIDTYPNYSNLSKLSLREAQKVEHLTFENADALVFSSKWAAESAEKDYNVPAEKISIISFGANMERIPPRQDIENKSIDDDVKILFLAVDWERKGGSLVFETFKMLVDNNINAKLTVCGCVPPKEFQHPQMTVIPFLNKNKEEDAQKLYDILRESNFLFLRSSADCTPIVFSEANSFGIPVFSSDVGGIGSVVEEGVSGHLFPLDSSAEKYYEKFKYYAKNKDAYSELSKMSRDRFESILNWDKWAKEIDSIFEKLLSQQ